MIIDVCSDLHGHYPKLEGGDLLIVAGDLTARDTFVEHCDFKLWLYEQKYKKKIVIAGNHDNYFMSQPESKYIFSSYNTQTREQVSYAEYLCDSETEFQGLKIYGTPWTKTFAGMNPHCKAFTVDTEEELAEKWKLIPDDTNILITHSPPHGILDKCDNRNVGSKSLRRIMGRVKPTLWVCAHIHEAYGEFKDISLSGINYHIINASYVNERYQPVNKPIRVIL